MLVSLRKHPAKGSVERELTVHPFSNQVQVNKLKLSKITIIQSLDLCFAGYALHALPVLPQNKQEHSWPLEGI